MKKSEIREIFEKFIESFPDDETEEKEEITEEKEEITEESTEEKEESTEEIIISEEKTETIRKIDENGNTVVERKEIYVDENTGEYMYR